MRLAPSVAWTRVKDFAYQLQNVNLKALARSKFDLAVIDYSADGSDAKRYGAKQIHAVQQGSTPSKRVLAYMSIGEAENYRWYWRAKWDGNNDGRPDAGRRLGWGRRIRIGRGITR